MTTLSLPIAVVLSALTTALATPADSNASPAWSTAVAHLAGTDRPLRIRTLGERDYELDYRKYRIRVTAGREAAGETIRVVPIQSPPKDPTSPPPKAAQLVSVAEENTRFWGVAGDFLFIDVGCCPAPRGLVIYDLAHRQRCFESSWMNSSGEPSLRQGRWLLYAEAIEDPPEKPDCVAQDDLREWIRQGGDIGYEEDVILDLRTLKITRSGKIRCGPRQ